MTTLGGDGLRDQKNCLCASACFFIWAAGSTREGERIYVHRPRLDPKVFDDLPEKAGDVYATVARDARSYLADMDVPTSIVDRMFDTASTHGSPLTLEELDQMGEAPYYSEFRISKCGPLPYPETFAKGGKRGKPLKSYPTNEQPRIRQLTEDYFDCSGKAHDDLADRALDRFANTFASIYGKEVTERWARGPKIDDRKGLEIPPLLRLRSGSEETIDTNLQATALWRVIKREFPDWYAQRIEEATALARGNRDEMEIGEHVARKLAELRRQHAASGLSASLPMLKTVGGAYYRMLMYLQAEHSPEACNSFIKQGEAAPLIVRLLLGSEQPGLAAMLQSHLTSSVHEHLTAVFEAIAEGRQQQRVHPRPSKAEFELLAAELTKRGWTQNDFQLLASAEALAQAEPGKACGLVLDFFYAQSKLSDSEARSRLLRDFLGPVFGQ